MNTLAGRVGPSAPTMALVGAMVVAAMFPRRAMAAPTTVGGLGGLAATLAGVTPAGSNSVFPSTSCIVTCNLGGQIINILDQQIRNILDKQIRNILDKQIRNILDKQIF